MAYVMYARASALALSLGVACGIPSAAGADSAPPHETAVERPVMPIAPALTSIPQTAGALRGRAVLITQVNTNALGQNVVGDAANEPSIAVDPTNPLNMAIGWRQFNTTSSSFREAGIAYTTDGGVTWFNPGPIEPGVFRTDPVLRADAEGRFYYNSLRVIGNDFTVHVFRSENTGASWDIGHFAYGGDKAWMAVDTTNGSGRNHLYQAWNLAGNSYAPATFNRSTDRGFTWSAPAIIPESPIFGTLAVGPDGELFVGGRGTSNRFMVIRSDNAKDPAATPSFPQVREVILGGPLGFSTVPNPAGLAGQMIVDVDRSNGPRRGAVYVLASIDPPGEDPLDVMFARSLDSGDTWSSAIRLNDDPPSLNSYQWFGTMSVAPNGRIDVIWNDTRGGLPQISQMYYCFSFDGGETWSLNEAITKTWNSHLGWPQQNKIGDYYDMVSDDDGVSIACSMTLNGEQDVFFIRIAAFSCVGTERDCTGNGEPDDCDIAVGAVIDANGNGVPDSCETPLCLADTNRDGIVNFDDITAVLAAWGSSGPIGRIGDSSGDGPVNLLDIVVVAERWLATCP